MTGTIPEERGRKKSIREISPIDVYKYLPKTNCRECGESNCMAFATRVVNGELSLAACPPLYSEEYQKERQQLEELLDPPVRTVMFGAGNSSVSIGGKYVLQRHEFTYHNPAPIAIDVDDLLSDEDLEKRVHQIERFSYPYIGRTHQIGRDRCPMRLWGPGYVRVDREKDLRSDVAPPRPLHFRYGSDGSGPIGSP